MKRRLFVAFLVSMLLHVMVIVSPRWRVDEWRNEMPVSLEATLVVRQSASAQTTSITKQKPKPRTVPIRRAEIPDPAPTPPPAALAPDVLPEAAPSHVGQPPVDEIAQSEPSPDVVREPQPTPAPETVPVLPRTGRIVYAISRGNGFTVGRAIHEWQHDGKRYRMRAIAETTGIAAVFKSVKAVQTSEGSFEQGELKPQDFRFDRGNGDVGTAQFDWSVRQVTLGDGQVVAIAEGAEDFLSMFYQLAQASARGEGFTMAVATGKKVERYAFDWLGDELVQVPAGTLSAWHVRVRAVSGGKDFTDVWLAKDMAGLPVKIRNTDRKGEVFEQSAVSVVYEGKEQ